MFDFLTDSLNEFIRDFLRGWVMANLEDLFNGVNNKVSTIGFDVGKTPSSWNSSIFSMIRTLSENVVVPIAGIIITYVLCYELIAMVMDKNNMHEFDTALFFRYLFKACIAVLLLSNTSDIVMAAFDVGSHMATSAASQIVDSTRISVSSTIQDMFTAHLYSMPTGDLISLGFETMICKLCLRIISMLITVIIYGRMIEIYLYVSVAPIPFATFANREWGNIGTNYVRGVFALAMQGFFIMVCVGIYAVLVSHLSVDSNLHEAVWQIMAYTVVLCFSLFKTGSLAKSVLNAR